MPAELHYSRRKALLRGPFAYLAGVTHDWYQLRRLALVPQVRAVRGAD